MTATDPRYPVGKFERKSTLTPDERRLCIEQIAETPAKLRDAIEGLSPQQLETPYREGGWTLREVAHHLPDSHLNAYCRFKLALTEDNPRIKAYDEAAWATLADTRETPVTVSLSLLESLHDRWVRILRSMKDDDFTRTLDHPENGPMTLDAMLGLYAWHGRHHVAHVTTTRERMGF
jgi:uncharacterized damage-inducible protein DinB